MRMVAAVMQVLRTTLDWIAMALLLVGGLNWGLVGLFGLDLVAAIFGPMSLVSRIVYVIIGLATVWVLYLALTVESPARTRLGRPL